MRAGFSLLELSIVLVIIGLLAGGVMTGQSLIRAAELRAVSTEFTKFQTALNAFRDKYQAFPGDMKTATAFWGTAGTCPGTNASPSTGTATCNGDGDGFLNMGVSTSNEIFRAWQHLANAGLIEGTFTGVSNSATANNPSSLNGYNIPSSKISNTGWTLYGLGTYTVADTGFFEGAYGNIFFFGGVNGANVSFYPVLKPEEAWNIDTKLDDGKPALGVVVSQESQGTTCSDLAASSTASMAAAVYLLSSTSSTACSLIFKIR